MTPYHHTPRYIYVMLFILWLTLAFGAFFYPEMDGLKLCFIGGFASITALLFVVSYLEATKQAKKFESFDPHPEIN